MKTFRRRKTKAMKRLEELHGEPIEETLSRLYIEEAKTLDEIAQLWGVSPSTVWFWLDRFDIPTRTLMLPGKENAYNS